MVHCLPVLNCSAYGVIALVTTWAAYSSYSKNTQNWGFTFAFLLEKCSSNFSLQIQHSANTYSTFNEAHFTSMAIKKQRNKIPSGHMSYLVLLHIIG